MSFALIIVLIAFIPVLLASALFGIYGKNTLTKGLFFTMSLLTCWQLDVAVLHFSEFFTKEQVLFLFKLFRMGNIFAIPSIFYIAYIAIKTQGIEKHNTLSNKIITTFLNKKTLAIVYIWSIGIYIISWTPYGVEDLQIIHGENKFYYPVSGELGYTFYIHMLLYVVGLILCLIAAQKIESKHLKNFMNTFFISTIGLYLLGMLNLNPNNGILIGSIGIMLFSFVIAYSFVKMHNETMKDYRAILERQSKLDYVGNITSSLIHEVKNSLAVIQGYSQILPYTQELNEKSKELLGYIQVSSTQLSNFVKGYQDFLKNQNIDFEEISIYHIINKSTSISKNLIDDNNFDVKITCPENLTGYVNDTYLTQVFVNLIKNSIEATDINDENKRLIKIDVYTSDETIIIDFIDKGKGIPHEMWEKIFYPFNSDKENGTGLGLPYCKQVVYAHRGEIGIVESNQNGTHFQVRLPQFKFTNYIKGD